MAHNPIEWTEQTWGRSMWRHCRASVEISQRQITEATMCSPDPVQVICP